MNAKEPFMHLAARRRPLPDTFGHSRFDSLIDRSHLELTFARLE
jgi:hypothetical protein